MSTTTGLPPGRARRSLRRPLPCRNCRQQHPPQDFPLYSHPPAASWATRTWCASCLVKAGHLRPAQAAKYARDFVAARGDEEDVRARVQRARVEAKAEREEASGVRQRVRSVAAAEEQVREHLQRREVLVNELLDRAAEDPDFAAAVVRAGRVFAESA